MPNAFLPATAGIGAMKIAAVISSTRNSRSFWLALYLTCLTSTPSLLYIDHILICHPPMRALMIPNVRVPIILRMISAGIVAIAHLTIRMTIDPNGILMSVTTTFPSSVAILVAS
jgi:hypothetical protein